jgi:hypothetical protein
MVGKSRKSNYRIENLGDIVRDEPSRIEKIFSDMDQLWEEFELPPGQIENLGDQNWNEILLEAGDYARVISHNDDLIGYWFFVPINQDMYRMGREGENINAIITADDIPLTLKPGFYRFYFVDFVIKKSHHRVCLDLVWDEIEKTLEVMAKKGVYIWKIIAHASTKQAINIASKLNFDIGKPHKHHLMFDKGEVVPWRVVELNFARDFAQAISSKRAKLIKKYLDAVKADPIISVIRKLECESIEFKTFDGKFEGILRAVAAMASTEGGVCVVGISDEDREVVGINLEKFRNSIDNFSLALCNSIHDKIDDLIPNQMKVHSYLFEGKWIVLVEVAPAAVSIDGSSLFRLGPSTRRLR